MATPLVWRVAVAASCAAAPTAFCGEAPAPATEYLIPDGDAVMVFLPAAARAERTLDDLRSRDSAEKTVWTVRQCLRDPRVAVRLAFTDRIVMRDAHGEQVFELDPPSLPGAMMIRSGASPRLVFAGGGAEALVRMVAPAAADYFGRACRELPKFDKSNPWYRGEIDPALFKPIGAPR